MKTSAKVTVSPWAYFPVLPSCRLASSSFRPTFTQCCFHLSISDPCKNNSSFIWGRCELQKSPLICGAKDLYLLPLKSSVPARKGTYNYSTYDPNLHFALMHWANYQLLYYAMQSSRSSTTNLRGESTMIRELPVPSRMSQVWCSGVAESQRWWTVQLSALELGLVHPWGGEYFLDASPASTLVLAKSTVTSRNWKDKSRLHTQMLQHLNYASFSIP